MRRVAVIRKRFLPLTETFIYEELTKLSRYKPYVFAHERLNGDQFPFKRVKMIKRNLNWRRILRKYKISLIHARFGTAGVEMLKVKRQTGLPMITSFHGHDNPRNKKNRKKYRSLRKLFKHGELFTVTNKQMKSILVRYGCPRRKIHIQHSGIDLHKFRYRERTMPKDKAIKILFVGRLVEKKGTEYLVKAFKKVASKFPKAQLTIVGDGERRKKIKRLIRKFHLKGKVNMIKQCTHHEVAELLDDTHLFCLPSVTGKNKDQEGIPNVLKEAMACGIPVISTRHAGIPELITHGKNGFLVKERDSQALARQLIKVMKHPEKWRKVGRKARKKVKQDFNSAKQVIRLEKLYDKAIKKRKLRRKKR